MFVSGDLARGQAGRIRKNFQIARQVGFPEGNVDEIATIFRGIQRRERLNNTASKKRVPLGGLFNNVGRENLRDDDIRAKSRHESVPKKFVVLRA